MESVAWPGAEKRSSLATRDKPYPMRAYPNEYLESPGMRSPLARGLVALAAVAAVVILFVVLAGGDDDGGSDTTTAAPAQWRERRVPPARRGTPGPRALRSPPRRSRRSRSSWSRAASPVGGVKRLSFDSGDRIQFTVKSDVSDEVHVHGYDISKDVPAGDSVRFSFPARLEGVFEVELEGRKQQIAELRVSPR